MLMNDTTIRSAFLLVAHLKNTKRGSTINPMVETDTIPTGPLLDENTAVSSSMTHEAEN